MSNNEAEIISPDIAEEIILKDSANKAVSILVDIFREQIDMSGLVGVRHAYFGVRETLLLGRCAKNPEAEMFLVEGIYRNLKLVKLCVNIIGGDFEQGEITEDNVNTHLLPDDFTHGIKINPSGNMKSPKISSKLLDSRLSSVFSEISLAVCKKLSLA